MSYEYSYAIEEALDTGILSAVLSGIPSTLLSIAAYVLTALALYTVAQRRGLNRPWLAWIPVVNCWIIGSLSDQYRYVVKDEIRSKRKVLLTLNILVTVISFAMGIIAVVMAAGAIGSAMYGASEEAILETVMGPVVGILGLCLPLIGVAIAFAIVRYMALYDIYKSMDPDNCVLFLVLSILISITEPFFLFFNRNKDAGMPPRRQEPSYIPRESVYAPVQEDVWQQPQQSPQDPWDQEDKDYL
nr:hypothetical protein [Oscillospiraceae bacterium]